MKKILAKVSTKWDCHHQNKKSTQNVFYNHALNIIGGQRSAKLFIVSLQSFFALSSSNDVNANGKHVLFDMLEPIQKTSLQLF